MSLGYKGYNNTAEGDLVSEHTPAIAVDFDGVIHKYSKGWHDGTIYDEPIEGAFDAIRVLMNDYAVFIFTSREPRQVADWLRDNMKPAVPTFITHHEAFWNIKGFLLVTNKKYPAEVYIDDRGLRFESWERTMPWLYPIPSVDKIDLIG